MKLTMPQTNWLVALYNQLEITTYGRTGNCKPLKRLIELGLVRVVDSSCGHIKKYLPMFSYTLTLNGKMYCKENEENFRKAGYAC